MRWANNNLQSISPNLQIDSPPIVKKITDNLVFFEVKIWIKSFVVISSGVKDY
jgi:hypothetical protein